MREEKRALKHRERQGKTSRFSIPPQEEKKIITSKPGDYQAENI